MLLPRYLLELADKLDAEAAAMEHPISLYPRRAARSRTSLRERPYFGRMVDPSVQLPAGFKERHQFRVNRHLFAGPE
jgi:hypothetical protein